MREVTKPSPEQVPKPYRTALVMNSIPTNVSTPRTATNTSTNTMPNATMCSLAASLLMSQGILCNVTEPVPPSSRHWFPDRIQREHSVAS